MSVKVFFLVSPFLLAAFPFAFDLSELFVTVLALEDFIVQRKN